MLDWSARVDDVVGLLEREFAITDREAIEILLSALIECPRTPRCWLILETNWYSRDCLDAWFSFGELWTPISLPRLRGRQPWREIDREIQEILDAPNIERLFVEPDFDRYPRYLGLSNTQFLLQRGLRIRTHSTRVANPLRGLDSREEERRADLLAAYTRAALEDPLGARPADPPVFREPPSFLYHCELLQRLSPWLSDWTILIRSLAALAVRHAYLYGRRETAPEDYAILARVAADTVPPWVANAMRLMLDAPAKIYHIEKAMALEEKSRRSNHGGYREMIRLRRQGVVVWEQKGMHWTLTKDHRQGVNDLLAKHAFGAESVAA